MIKKTLLCIFFLIALSVSWSYADRLPSNVSENQQFSIDTVVDATGSFEDITKIDWALGKNATPSDNILNKSAIMSIAVYSDSLISNGGTISENKNTLFDSSSAKSKTFNIDSEKILAYNSMEGAHLTGEERLILTVDGNYSSDKTNETKCLLSEDDTSVYPAFSDYVLATSELLNMNSGHVSTKAQIRNVGSSSTSSGMNYQIAVTPDTNYERQFAESSVKTKFAGTILEARDGKSSSSSSKSSSKSTSSDNSKKAAVTNEWKDESEVIGGIKNFQKSFAYQSGMKV